MTPDDTTRRYTTKEAAAVLGGISIRTFQRWCRKYGVDHDGTTLVGQATERWYTQGTIDYLRDEHARQTGQPRLTIVPPANDASTGQTTDGQSNSAVAVRPVDNAAWVTLYHDNIALAERVGAEKLRADMLAATLAERDAELAALKARQHTPRRRWWQRRQREDVG